MHVPATDAILVDQIGYGVLLPAVEPQGQLARRAVYEATSGLARRERLHHEPDFVPSKTLGAAKKQYGLVRASAH